MHTPRFRIVALLAIALSALIVVLVLPERRPPVSLIVRGFTTNSWWRENADGTRNYLLCAVVELTNGGDFPVTYLGNRHSNFVNDAVLYRSPTGWTNPTPRDVLHAFGWGPFTLASSHCITFQTEVQPGKRCKIEVDYWDDRTRNRLWQHLPQRLVQLFSWVNSSRTVTTDELMSPPPPPRNVEPPHWPKQGSRTFTID